MVEGLLVCPRCRRAVTGGGDAYRCAPCGAAYPVVAGIPDFRVAPDPYIGLEEDRAKARGLADAARTLGFAELVEHYYEVTPEVPRELAARYRAHHLAGADRGRGLAERLRSYGLGEAVGPGGKILDLGCGTGGFLRAAAAAGALPVGVDVALRWLVIARRGLEEAGRGDVLLLCACAEALPLSGAVFDLVAAENLLEHAREPGRVLSEARRVLRPGGAFAARAVNRYAPGPEPHVGVWFLGFLPRRAMDRWVRLRRGIPYRHVRLPSLRELRRLVSAGGHRGWRVRRPLLVAADLAHQSSGRRRLLAFYARLGELLPPLRPLLARFGPYLDVVGRTDQ